MRVPVDLSRIERYLTNDLKRSFLQKMLVRCDGVARIRFFKTFKPFLPDVKFRS